MKSKIHPYFKQKLTISTNGSTYSYDFPSLSKNICKSLLRVGNNHNFFHQHKLENSSYQEKNGKGQQNRRRNAKGMDIVVEIHKILFNFFELRQEKNISYTIIENSYYSNALSNPLGNFFSFAPAKNDDSLKNSPKQHFVRLSLETAANSKENVIGTITNTAFLQSDEILEEKKLVQMPDLEEKSLSSKKQTGITSKNISTTTKSTHMLKKPSMFSICDTDTFSHPF
jgi:hypothetical protein